jgi:hypothetical protein
VRLADLTRSCTTSSFERARPPVQLYFAGGSIEALYPLARSSRTGAETSPSSATRRVGFGFIGCA